MAVLSFALCHEWPYALALSMLQQYFKCRNLFMFNTTIREILTISIFLCLNGALAFAHDFHADAEARYLGNEGVLISASDTKVLFDPFFHKNFGIYQLVPEPLRKAVFDGTPPYDGVNAIFISHVHADHFSAADVAQYLTENQHVTLFAPSQAVKELTKLVPPGEVDTQISKVELNYGDPAVVFELDGIRVEAVRIPHAGGPGRAHIENIVYRVALNETITVMHMGDAAPNDDDYLVHKEHWKAKVTDTAFPPYWFFSSAEGNYILNSLLNARQHIGVHVPFKVPDRLQSSGKDYFSKPGEVRTLAK